MDYETATYGYRGIDIGGHFTDRMYCWSHPGSKLTGYCAPGVDEQRSFCASYLQEMQDLGVEMTANDTETHLMMEANIGRMYQILFSVLMSIVWDGIPDEPPLFTGLAHVVQAYRELKHDFEQRCNQGRQ